MPPPNPVRLPRSAADRLLDGGAGPEPLRQLLAAAAAPARADELGDEQAARLAFTRSAGLRPLPDVAVRNSRRRTRALSWIVAAKAITALALTAGAGGVAVAATSNSFPDAQPDVSTHRESDPGSPATPPTVIVDRAHDTAQQPSTEPAQEPSPGPPPSARHDRTEPGGNRTSTAPPRRPDQPSRPQTNTTDDKPPTARSTLAPGNPQHATGPANGNRRATPQTPPGQQQEKKNEKEKDSNNAAGVEKDHPVKSAGQE